MEKRMWDGGNRAAHYRKCSCQLCQDLADAIDQGESENEVIKLHREKEKNFRNQIQSLKNL